MSTRVALQPRPAVIYFRRRTSHERSFVSHNIPFDHRGRTRVRPLHGTGIHRRVFEHCSPLLARHTAALPHVHGLSPARSTTAAPPHPRPWPAPRPSTTPASWLGAERWNDRRWFPRSLLSGRRVRHPALPLRYRHGYAVDLHHGLPTPASNTGQGVPHLEPQAGAHREPAHIRRVRAGVALRGVTTPVPCVYLLVSLTGPGPSGSTGPSRLCRGCSHLPRRPPGTAASSFTPPLRRQGDEGLPPPSGTSAPRGALLEATMNGPYAQLPAPD